MSFIFIISVKAVETHQLCGEHRTKLGSWCSPSTMCVKDIKQLIRLGSRSFYQLSHLTSPLVACVYVHLYACLCIYMYVYTSIYCIYTYIYMHMYRYVCGYICIYTNMYVGVFQDISLYNM